MSLINREALADAMYDEAFEKDSEEQKWDGGCWIRYKMFERVVFDLPSVDAVAVVRCRDCKYFNHHIMECEAIGKWFGVENEWGANDYCSKGERREE